MSRTARGWLWFALAALAFLVTIAVTAALGLPAAPPATPPTTLPSGSPTAAPSSPPSTIAATPPPGTPSATTPPANTPPAEFAAFVAGHAGALGQPSGPVRTWAGGWRQDFAKGAVIQGRHTVGAVTGPLRGLFAKAESIARYGFPDGLTRCVGDLGCVQPTDRATLYRTGSGRIQVVPHGRTVRLTGSENFRDVAGEGAGLPLTGGGHLRRGVLYRAARLTPATSWDLLVLRTLGLRTVYDLRTDDVANRAPELRLPGVTRQRINIYAVYRTAAPRWSDAAQARAWMRTMNRNFVVVPAQRAAIARLLRAVAAARGPVLFHCSEGKDRSGWISMLLQRIAGVSAEDAMAEYLKSNDYRRSSIEAAFAADLKTRGRTYAEGHRALLRVERGYLEAGLRAAEDRYGSLNGYLTKGLGLTTADLAALRDRLRG